MAISAASFSPELSGLTIYVTEREGLLADSGPVARLSALYPIVNRLAASPRAVLCGRLLSPGAVHHAAAFSSAAAFLRFRPARLRRGADSFGHLVHRWLPVRIGSSDATPREAALAWLPPAPQWKTAWRAEDGPDGLMLTGWAVLENANGQDWAEVELTLTTGVLTFFEVGRGHAGREAIRETQVRREAIADALRERILRT